MLASHVGEDGRLHVVAAVEPVGPAYAARHQRGALVYSLLDVSLHAVELRAADQRADRRALGERVAHPHRGRGLAGEADDLLVEVARDQHARRARARLPRVEETGLHALGNERGQVRVVEQDIRRLAAQFLRHTLDGQRRVARHLDTGARGAGE